MEETPYELWKGRKPNVSYFHIFGSPCYILRDNVTDSKFATLTDPGIFVGYSNEHAAYRIYNKATRKIIVFVNVSVNDRLSKLPEVVDDSLEVQEKQASETSDQFSERSDMLKKLIQISSLFYL